MPTLRPCFLVALALLAPAVPALAQGRPPATLSYQGYVEQNGEPVDGTRTLRFGLYEGPSGGAPLWSEVQPGVPISDGIFSVTLGAVTPLPVEEFYQALWLEVAVGTTILSPRTALTAAPYALGLVFPQIHDAAVGGTAFAVNNTGTGDGIRGEAQASGARGVVGQASAFAGAGYGVYGLSNAPDGAGVYGRAAALGTFVEAAGVYGVSLGGRGYGVRGEGGQFGVYGVASTGTYGALGVNGSFNDIGVYGVSEDPDDHAAYFDGTVTTDGDVFITGSLSVAGTKNFRIDHPLDPEHRYLNHFAVESSEVLNVYSGNVTTDADGYATVVLPDWFEALNADFRYQLTVVGTFAQAIVAEKVRDNRFVIRTDVPGVEVSWQVTGVRSDPAARAHRPVEEWKPAEGEPGQWGE